MNTIGIGCPACGVEKSRICHTSKITNGTHRYRKCVNGHNFSTFEYAFDPRHLLKELRRIAGDARRASDRTSLELARVEELLKGDRS